MVWRTSLKVGQPSGATARPRAVFTLDARSGRVAKPTQHITTRDTIRVSDGFAWEAAHINPATRPVVFHATSASYVDSILRQGLAASNNPIADVFPQLVRMAAIVDPTEVHDEMSVMGVMNSRNTLVSCTLSWSTACSHAMKGPEHLERMHTVATQLTGESLYLDQGDRQILDSIMQRLDTARRDYKPVLLVMNPFYELDDMLGDHDEYWLSHAKARELAFAEYRKGVLPKVSDPVGSTDFSALLREDPLLDSALMLQDYYRRNNYEVSLASVGAQHMLGVIDLEFLGE